MQRVVFWRQRFWKATEAFPRHSALSKVLPVGRISNSYPTEGTSQPFIIRLWHQSLSSPLFKAINSQLLSWLRKFHLSKFTHISHYWESQATFYVLDVRALCSRVWSDALMTTLASELLYSRFGQNPLSAFFPPSLPHKHQLCPHPTFYGIVFHSSITQPNK